MITKNEILFKRNNNTFLDINRTLCYNPKRTITAEIRIELYTCLCILTLNPATESEMTPSAVSAENCLVSKGVKTHCETAIFVILEQSPWAFRRNWVYHNIYFRFYAGGLDFGSNVHLTGFATTSIIRIWSKNINFTDVTFLNVKDWQEAQLLLGWPTVLPYSRRLCKSCGAFMQIGPAVLPGYKTSQTTDRQRDRRHAVPKARPIVRSAKNGKMTRQD